MRRAEIQNVQFAARFENAINLSERAALVVSDEVVNDKAGDHSVKNGIRIRQGGSESFIPLNICTARFISRDVQHLRVAVQACDFGCGVRAFEHESQRASAATEIKHFHLWLDVCLLN